MAHSTVAGQPAITRAGCYDAEAAYQMQDVTCNGLFLSLTGSADVISFPGNTAFDGTGVDSATIVAPKAGQQPAGDDGKKIFVVDTGGHAHTITGPSNCFSPSHHIATFGGNAGSIFMAMAYNGTWYPLVTLGVTMS